METYNSIELTKQLVKDGKISQEIAETIFPELKESEDERIRKMLIGQMERWHECALENNVVQHIKDSADAIAWLEKQGSPEKTCKDEPKFKVGDWIVYNDDICQIVKREEGCNKLVTNFGIEKELVNERNLSIARPWTIQDAKDGDALVASDGSIFLFKCNDDGACKHYVSLTNDVLVFNTGLKHWWETSKAVRPATKEQRDLLFQKMKEAGYEWDAEKKELKKEEVDNLHNYLYGEQNPAWSEEDEENLNWFEKFFRAESVVAEGKDIPQDRYLWFKKLKERVQPQNTLKPSAEQMEALDDFIYAKYPNVEKHGAAVKSLYQDLKKLTEH